MIPALRGGRLHHFFLFLSLFSFCYEPARKGYRWREEARKNGGFCYGVALMDLDVGFLSCPCIISSLSLLFPCILSRDGGDLEHGSIIGPGHPLSWGGLALHGQNT
jgi:hypothetical protein